MGPEIPPARGEYRIAECRRDEIEGFFCRQMGVQRSGFCTERCHTRLPVSGPYLVPLGAVMNPTSMKMS